ncbi:MAG: DNA-binding protein [Erysipelotrichaceae bacterium]
MNREYYEILYRKYPDVVTLKQLRKMLGGIAERTALKLMQDNVIEHFYIRQEYLIPKVLLIDFVVSEYYQEYKKLLKHTV